MEQWRKDGRAEVVMVDLEAPVRDTVFAAARPEGAGKTGAAVLPKI